MIKLRNNEDIFHTSFEIALILKAANGILEIIGSILLAFVNSSALKQLVFSLTQGELSEDPNDFVATALLHLSEGYSLSAQHFAVFYLASHGVVKLFLVLLLWRKKLWAYPLTMIFLSLFILYQVYRYMVDPTFMLILLTLLDLALIILTFIEFKRQKKLLIK